VPGFFQPQGPAREIVAELKIGAVFADSEGEEGWICKHLAGKRTAL